MGLGVQRRVGGAAPEVPAQRGTGRVVARDRLAERREMLGPSGHHAIRERVGHRREPAVATHVERGGIVAGYEGPLGSGVGRCPEYEAPVRIGAEYAGPPTPRAPLLMTVEQRPVEPVPVFERPPCV